MLHDTDLLDRLDAFPKKTFDGAVFRGTHRTLKLVWADLEALGVPEAAHVGITLPRTQEIGAAIEFLGCDGLIAPCARRRCDNLILFPDRMGVDASLELVTSEVVNWAAWATAHDLLE